MEAIRAQAIAEAASRHDMAAEAASARSASSELIGRMEAQQRHAGASLQEVTAELVQAKKRAAELATRTEEMHAQVAADAARAGVMGSELASALEQRDMLVSQLAALEANQAALEESKAAE
eukprot:9479635-Pyramimonas_sp.AAC.1